MLVPSREALQEYGPQEQGTESGSPRKENQGEGKGDPLHLQVPPSELRIPKE